MQPTYRYGLRRGTSTWFSVVGGNVVQTNIQTFLNHSPIDWEKGIISFERNLNYWGIFVQYSLPFQFVLDGGQILRELYYTEGHEAVCNVYIEKLNTTSFTYEFFFEGSLNFYKSNDARDSFTIECLDKGASELIKSNSGIDVEVPLSLPTAITTQLDGVKFKARAAWVLGDSSKDDPNFPAVEHGTANGLSGTENVPPSYSSENTQFGYFFLPANAKFTEYSSSFHSLGAGYYDSSLSGTAQTDLTDVSFGGSISTRMVVDNIGGGSATGFFFKVYATVCSQPTVNPFGTIISQTLVATTATIAPSTFTDIVIPISGTIPLIANTQTITFSIACYHVGGSPSDHFLWRAYYFTTPSTITMDYYAKVGPSDCKMLGYLDVLKYIINNVSQGANSVTSSFLSNTATDSTTRFNNWDNLPAFTKLTSGTELRGQPNAAIKASFDDIKKDLYVTYGIGVGVDDENVNVIVEPIQYFFKDELIMDIDVVQNITITPLEDEFVNGLNIGYDFPSNGTQNTVGENEFNTTIQYLADAVKGVNNVDDLVSPVNASIFLIEGTRTTTAVDTKADNSSDNTTFKVEVDPTPISGKYHAFRPSGAIITGVDDPTGAYNVFLNPAYCVLRRLPFDKSRIMNGNLKFQTIKINPDLVSTYLSGTVVETGDINLELDIINGHDVSRIFLPYVVDFDFVPLNNAYLIIKNKPTGYVTFPYYGKTVRAHVKKIDLNPETGETHFQGFIHKADLSKLIR